ncbi:autoinducer binding domain-containing protein [Methylocapsa polymorpha]|uniref:Autoinducer binding domain-containing protein n=1 Tax=Methylocapsa polymorpha TaxID=3080828 RepID=A0ABZ0HQ95_9HYPH|nr:autoinducer binding domain-containing protein [Methylocapsa sp. RX1]
MGRIASLDDLDLRSLLRLDADLTDKTLEEFLELIRRRYRLSGVAYFCPSFRGYSLTDPFILRTRGAAWADAYRTTRRALNDPIIQIGARSMLPIDWARIRRRSKDENLRIGDEGDRQGLIIPVRGPTNGVWALFLVKSKETDAEWTARRQERTTDLVHVANYVHQRACEMHGEAPPAELNAITKREIEALEWAAEGKTVEDIAILMRISAETVKAHLDSARYKLGALTRIHAVTKAIRSGLVH